MAKRNQKKNMLVRGPDGALYLIGKGKLPIKLSQKESRKITHLVRDAERRLEKLVYKELERVKASCSRTLQIEVFDARMQ